MWKRSSHKISLIEKLQRGRSPSLRPQKVGNYVIVIFFNHAEKTQDLLFQLIYLFRCTCIVGQRFMCIRKSESVFATEDWKELGTSLFMPVSQDLFINTNKYEQLSLSEGSFFVADMQGNYSRSASGIYILTMEIVLAQHQVLIL